MGRSHSNQQKHMKNANCLQEFVHKKMFKMSTICKDTYLETLSSLVNCSVNNDLSEIGAYRKSAIKHSLSLLRTVNEQKAKCWYFAWC